jgi:hypothetical protein
MMKSLHPPLYAMNEDSTPTNKPPLLSYVTFRNFIEGIKKSGIVPSRIDKTLMDGQSGSVQSYLLSALKFFGLTASNGTPTEDLEALLKAEGDERKDLLKKLFVRSYGPMLDGLDLERATLGMLNEKFSKQGFSGDSLRKCHSFFAMAADDAGVPLSPQLKVSPPRNGGTTGGPRKPRKKPSGKPVEAGDVDEFADDPDAGGGGGGETHQVATLLLDREGKRVVRLKAPATITKTELTRVQQWLSFQLIVEDAS